MDVFVARQAIFDSARRVHGYELLFRSSGNGNQFDGTEASLATTQVLANSLLAIGLDTLVGGKKAFINFGRDLLLTDWHATLPKESCVIEILEDVEPEPDVIAACQRLQQQGYEIALDDFVFREEYEPLLAVASLVKVEIHSVSRPEQEERVRCYKARGLRMLAEKVETYEEFEWARRAGYDYFQGYFFARPVVLTSKQIPVMKLHCLRLVQETQRADLDLLRLAKTISEDVSLTYKLLRYVNSALFYHSYPIQSIHQSLLFLGETNVRKWVAMAALLSSAEDKPGELLVHSLVRARFCELIGTQMASTKRQAVPIGTEEQPFLMGLFSMLDALVDRPLDQALAEVKLGSKIEGALLGHAPPEDHLATSYRMAQRYETGDWESVSEIGRQAGLDMSAISQAYCDAVKWADNVVA
jgi:c-di-GMP-related signal transduction protein